MILTIFLITIVILGYRYYYGKEQGDSCKNCNVILITFDALNPMHLGAYGYAKNTSPNIDKLAEKSYIFKDSISQCGSTPCSLASIHTSKYPFIDGIVEKGDTLRENESTLAEILSEHNISTYAVTAIDYAMSGYGYAQGFNLFDDDFKGPESANTTVQRVKNMLENAINTREKTDKPFFLWIHFREPHTPYDPPKELFNEFYNNPLDEQLMTGINGPMAIREKNINKRFDEVFEYYTQNKSETSEDYVLYGGKSELTKSMFDQVIAMYDGTIKKADKEFGNLMEYLDETKLSDNTVIMISADHGESMGEHKIIDHNDLYYSIIHTPMIIHFPSDKHKTIEYPVSNLDIAPTILSIFQIQDNTTSHMRGLNLFNPSRNNYTRISEYKKIKTLIKNDYKIMVHTKRDQVTLFNIKEDPEETKGLMDEDTTKIEELLGILEDIMETGEDMDSQVDTLERLREIGYAN